MATDPDGDPVFHSLARAGDSLDYAFFDINTNTGALTVSPIGADDDVGLGIGLYDLGVVASDGGPVRGEVGVTIQVKARTAPLGDGCAHESRRWPQQGRQGHRRKAPALAQHGKDVLPRLYGHSDRGYIAYG